MKTEMESGSSLDLLRSILGQKDLGVTLEMVVDQRLLSERGASTQERGKGTHLGFAVASNSVVPRHPNEPNVKVAISSEDRHSLNSFECTVRALRACTAALLSE